MSRGLPIVVSESTGISELITDSVEGFVIRDDKQMDSQYVASVLKEFIVRPSIISKMSEKVIEISQNLTWEINVERILNLILKIL